MVASCAVGNECYRGGGDGVGSGGRRVGQDDLSVGAGGGARWQEVGGSKGTAG
jgi:hypothetical protein